MTTSKFSRTEVVYHDTKNTGGISIEGIQLESDEDRCIEAPSSFAKKLEPHGFVQKTREKARLDDEVKKQDELDRLEAEEIAEEEERIARAAKKKAVGKKSEKV